MKYLRTKTNIYEIVSETETYYVVKGKRNGTEYRKYKNDKTIVKKSDRIIDLLDACEVCGQYFTDIKCRDILTPNNPFHASMHIYESFEDATLCGLIHTNEGYSYVAEYDGNDFVLK